MKRGLIYSSFIDIRDYVFELEELLKKNETLYRITVDKNRGRDIDTGLLIAFILFDPFEKMLKLQFKKYKIFITSLIN